MNASELGSVSTNSKQTFGNVAVHDVSDGDRTSVLIVPPLRTRVMTSDSRVLALASSAPDKVTLIVGERRSIEAFAAIWVPALSTATVKVWVGTMLSMVNATGALSSLEVAVSTRAVYEKLCDTWPMIDLSM